jgi:hypothetical protein
VLEDARPDAREPAARIFAEDEDRRFLPPTLAEVPRSPAKRLAVAGLDQGELRRTPAVSQRWIADALEMGSAANVRQQFRRRKIAVKTARLSPAPKHSSNLSENAPPSHFPGESRNLAESRNEDAKLLWERLNAWRSDVGASMVEQVKETK